ncbi:uncharacterized protein [Euwallacea fornicatus]|uniref:uncharacterized protein n=1 Tax=Euwallacea fornicatus TaxID=995702 RepID=UPI0033906AC1
MAPKGSTEELITRRTVAKGKLTRLQTWLRKDLPVDLGQYTVRQTELSDTYKTYSLIQEELELLDFDKYCGDRDCVEEQYFSLAATLTNAINQFQTENTSQADNPRTENVSSGAISSSIKLPELRIPTFDGTISNWQGFSELFNTLITNDQHLSDVKKLIYLRSSLKDEPARLLESLEMVGSNFEIAQRILRDRYENKNLIVNSYIKNVLNVPTVTRSNAQNLREFVTQVRCNIGALANFNVSERLADLIFIQILTQKLDFHLKRSFESERDNSEYPTLTEFIDFLEKKCKVLESLSTSDKTPKPRGSHYHSHHISLDNRDQANHFKCFLCKAQTHRIYACSKFLSLSPEERSKVVKNGRACINCLASGHWSINCKSASTCKTCHKKHNTLLHLPDSSVEQTNPSNLARERDHSQSSHVSRRKEHPTHSITTVSQQGQSHTGIDNHQPPASLSVSSQSHEVLLGTAIVMLYDSHKRPVEARCLLDSGSQLSFVTEGLVKRLNLSTQVKPLQITGISQNSSITKEITDLYFYPRLDRSQQFKTTCAVLKKITCQQPQFPINPHLIPVPHNIQLADPTYYNPAEIEILLGADIYYNLITDGNIKLGAQLPVLQNTRLGYIIAGKVEQPVKINSNCCTLHKSNNNNNSTTRLASLHCNYSELNNLIKAFWEIEEVKTQLPTNKFLTPENQRIEQLFESTTKILPNGRYQVDLPLKSSKEYQRLGDSFTQAKRRFFHMERRLNKDQDLFKKYQNFINQYVSLGHANYIPFSSVTNSPTNRFFLPHHCVIRNDSATTKLRVVFDGSMKSTTGVCLNDLTHKGYPIQPDLFDILIKFRTFRYVFTADIEKMFRQILVNPNHRFLQTILWRDSPEEPLKFIELATVTYGTNCAPFLSTRCLQDIATKNQEQYPFASKALLNHCYVDDILFGSNNLNNLLEAHSQLTSCLKTAHMTLHKWSSNSTEFLKIIAEENPNPNYVLMPEGSSNKVLGLSWNPNIDSFSIIIPEIRIKEKYTKREVLATIASIYDPIGIINPIVVSAKLIMQEIWKNNCDWDDTLIQPTLAKWKAFLSTISALSSLSIPRHVFRNDLTQRVEIHGFSDASMKAYGACIYIRAFYRNGKISCNLLSAKSRVAPLKVSTLPKLELMGAVLLSDLTERILSIVRQLMPRIDSINLWTDSEIVLAWLQSSPARWATFVANRVSHIQQSTSKAQWRHVCSKENPADILSRGSVPFELLRSHLWWNGPPFLREHNINLDKYNYVTQNSQPIPEERKVAAHLVQNSRHELYETFAKFSSFTKAQRVLAYCWRFIRNAKGGKKPISVILEVEELRVAEQTLIKAIQAQHFITEIERLKGNQPISKGLIQKLAPFLCEDKLLRVGGRLSNAPISYNQKHPIVLPSKCHLVRLLLEREHVRLLHSGPQTVLSNIRLRYWPLDGLREVKRVIHRCLTCFKLRATAANQLMAHLPKERLQVTRPFTNVGVDYGGPYSIKSSRLRKASSTKAYIAIFVCLSTRAVHLELVSELSTQAFLLTLKRFISRRGIPTTIFSDNAKNFLGARNQLKSLYDFFKSKATKDSIQTFTSKTRISWKFIPPRSPHHGGIWEAAIKSAKYHLIRIMGNMALTFEEMSTILTQIEAVMNSRPLCQLSDDPCDLNCLTPGHFLIGSNLMSYPEPDLEAVSQNRLSIYKKCTWVQQQFWKCWSKSVLNQLQIRPKWSKATKNIEINDIVLLKDEQTHPLRWPLARVVEVFTGKDNLVRVIKVKTQGGEYTRAITKVCSLPPSP